MAPSLLGTGSKSLLRPAPLPPATPDEPAELDAQQLPPGYRRIDDTAATRQLIYERVQKAIEEAPPAKFQQYELRVTNPRYGDEGSYDYAQQKDALLRNRSLGRPLLGSLELWDTSGEQPTMIDRRTKVMLARVPFMTDQGTFIHRGVAYQLANQQRQRPGIYTRQRSSGELESHVNTIPGKGVSHRYTLDPTRNRFQIEIGTATVPMITALRAMGANDEQLRTAWGDQILQDNYQLDTEANRQKLWKLLAARDWQLQQKDVRPGETQAAIAEAFSNMEMDGDVNAMTLGKAYDKLGLEAMLAASRKLLDVHQRKTRQDDRDHLAYKNFLGPEDIFAQRVLKDAGRLRREAVRKAAAKGSLASLPAGFMQQALTGAILNSGLGSNPEEINSVELLDKLTRVTSLGEGAISSIDSVPDAARNVHASQLGFIDVIRTPESGRAGIDAYYARNLIKAPDGRVLAPFVDARTGKTVLRSPRDLAKLNVALDDPESTSASRLRAIRKGRLGYVAKSDVDLIIPNYRDTFSHPAQLVPALANMMAQRVSMGSRMSGQALPLIKPEAPLVRSKSPEGPAYETLMGQMLGTIKASQPGQVLSVEPGGMHVRYADGATAKIPLMDNYPMNRKTLTTHTPLVRPGQNFAAGDLLARTNYVDDTGTLALGINARVGYMPTGRRGANFEDAIVVSESFANRMGSEHLYQHQLDLDTTDELKRSRREYLALFPGKFNRQQMDTLDDDGIVRPGTTVQEGDPLIVAARQNEAQKGRLLFKRKPTFSDASETWTHSAPGVVTDVVKDDKAVTVVVKAAVPMKAGDKVSGRFGDKGVLAEIVPDHQMPHDAQGNPLEIIVNDLGVISRGNPSQVYEAVLGKIAAQRGEPYDVEDFKGDLSKFVEQEMQKYGVKDTETLIDPDTGRKIPDVLVGNRFFMKLSHQAEDKLQGRGQGAGYTQDDVPAKSGDEKAKRLSMLETNALMSHGAVASLRDRVYRGQRSEDAWMAYMSGHPMPAPKVPTVFKKFVSQLQAAGINVVEEDDKFHIMALTNKDVAKLSQGRYVTNADTLDFYKGGEPVKGGLMDPKITGGPDGQRWAAIKLAEPVLNPVMELPARTLLGLTEKKFQQVLGGEEEIPGHGTGPQAIAQALEAIDIPGELAQARKVIASKRGVQRDQAVRRLKYLKSAQRLGIHPGEWVWDEVPVIPPKFRPVSQMQGKNVPLVSDANYLYRELMDANDLVRQLSEQTDDVGQERRGLYRALKAVVGLGDPLHPELQEKRVRGFLTHLFANSPKFGTVQRKLLSSNVDLVGRGVIAPDATLDMDSVGLPEPLAWDIYKPFIARRLKRRGMSLLDAVRSVRDRTSEAREELLREMRERPVLISRAPTLHKFGILAARPRLVKGNSIKISPLVVGGFGADFDGDQMNVHVPASDEARDEYLEKLLPSKNLLSPADFSSPVHVPGQEFVTGLYLLSAERNKKPVRTFANKAAAVAAWRRGEIEPGDPIEIG